MRKALIGGLTITILLAMGGLRVADLWRSRETRLAAAEQRATNLTLILSQYLSEAFAANDAALRQLALHGRRIGGPDAPDHEWAPSLASARSGITGMGSVSVIDRHGIVRHSTRRDIIGQSRNTNAATADVLGSDKDELIVGDPIRAVVSPFTLLIPLARPITDTAGRVNGAIVAAFIPEQLRRFFASVNVGESGTVWVFHPNGTLLFREPSLGNTMGERATEHPLYRAAQRQQSGVLRSPVEPSGPEMISAYRRGDGLRLIAGVSLDRDEVLVNWRGEAAGFAWVFSAAASVLAITLFGLFRQIDAKAAAELELAHARQLEAERLRQANQRLEATLEREQAARREGEAASALKDQFLLTVSHELRTPLTAIAGWSRMLLDGMVSESRRHTAIESIARNAHTQTRLIEDLLDVSAAMAGKLRLELRPVDVADVVRSAVEALRGAADAKQIPIELSLNGGARVQADPERLQQVVSNLVSNSIKFTPTGGRVRVALHPHNSHVELVVSDTGMGIDRNFLPHVFDQFRQADATPTRRHGGLGLGLAIVHSLVELHGGQVTAESEGLNRGATFTVTLPVTSAT